MRWVLRFRIYAIVFLAVLLIFSAVIFTVLRAALPYATGYKYEIQHEVSKLIGLPVTIDSIDATIYWFSPRLKLIGVTIQNKDNESTLLEFREAFVQLDVLASILHREIIVDDIGMVGTDISVEKLSDNEWSVQGIKFNSEGSSEISSALIYMLQHADYLLHDSRIIYKDHTRSNLSLILENVNVDVKNEFNTHNLKLSLSLPDQYGRDLAVVAKLQGNINSLNGEIYVEAQQLNVKQWNQKFKLFTDYQIDTTLDADLWISLDSGNIRELISQLSASDFSVKNKSTSEAWNTDYLATNIRFTDDKFRRSITVSELYFGEQASPTWPIKTNIIAHEYDKNYYLSSDYLRLADVQKILQVFLDEDKLSKLKELQAYSLQADVYNLELKLPKGLLDLDLSRETSVDEDPAGESLAGKTQVDKTPAGKELAEKNLADKNAADEGPVDEKLVEKDQVDKNLVDEDPVNVENTELVEKNLLDKELLDTELLDTELASENLAVEEGIEQGLIDKIYFQASISNLSLYDSKNTISLTGIDASLLFDEGQATIDLISKDAKVEMPTVFINPLHAKTLQGRVLLSHDAAGWNISSENVQLKNDHINSFSRLDILVPATGKLFLDVQTNFYDAYGKHITYYLPVGMMSDALVQWLNMAVTDGYVPSGQLIIHGDFDDLPFDKHDGVFQAVFPANNVNMRFLSKWPLLNNASATLRFNNRSLQAKNATAVTRRVDLYNGFAEIKDLSDAHLTVKMDARARNEDVQAYIWQSPLDDMLGNTMRLFQFTGSSDLNLTIDVPLEDEVVEASVDGLLKFNDTGIYLSALDYEVKELNGVVNFTEDSISADTMPAKIEGEKILLNAFTREGKSGQETVFHLEGEVQADYLLKGFNWIPDNWIAGKSMWSLDLEVPYHPKDYLVNLKVDSYMDGIDIQVSDKVHKIAADKLLFSATVDVLDNNGLRVDASADMVDVEDTKVDNVFTLYATRDESKVWEFDVDSVYLSGKGNFSEYLTTDTTVKLDLEKIDLYAWINTANSAGFNQISPDIFPQLDWKVKKLRWDEWVLSDVVLDTDWNKHGMVINKFSLKGPAMTFNARGTWLKSWRNTQETVLQGSMTSSNFGDTLTGLGFERSINHGSVKATYDAKWPAAPYVLSWENMTGSSTFNIKKGEVLKVDPGASGRLLGLLNIFELTNRLAFDFNDVTQKGFTFDYMKGEFEFDDGNGNLKSFNVSAPAADVNMFGSIGLLKHDYGLLMQVKPHTDTLTFAGGFLLGGVAVGVGLALIQKVFDLGILGHTVYSITGSWDDPEIEKIIEKTLDEDEDEDF